jgi:hypothetical protein
MSTTNQNPAVHGGSIKLLERLRPWRTLCGVGAAFLTAADPPLPERIQALRRRPGLSTEPRPAAAGLTRFASWKRNWPKNGNSCFCFDASLM